ncbi:L-lactate dehydrogenase [Alterisphingorhabdus coralli]|uniref:L-lactate dehydrogenase n=1 Tax=Alterisphingorhabdus coralli TaxID=3071408 RepID=A0AA97I134_9SPHN|nr:L-lactate dehydrogenase [Parasphingorhabdus sp. SCSIO 66989]WOE75647.1 L-lactate dehydrogenase [Parasphingorhabdus sp. SCSIO 66989]
MVIAEVADFREAARRRVPHFLFEYIDGGSYQQVTLGRNVEDLADVTLGQWVLRDVSEVDPSITLFGQRLSLPLVLAPVGLAGLNARRGEVQAARAANVAGVPLCLSTVSACTIEEVAAESGQPPWFQLYMLRDRGFVTAMLDRAKAASCPALVFTVDLPVPGARYRDRRSGLTGAPGLSGQLQRLGQALAKPGWCWDVGLRGRPLTLGNVAGVLGSSAPLSDFLGWLADNFDPAATWKDLEWVRSQWSGPLIVKGILHPDDARAALAAGADGIVVSNHGGRQLDGAMSAVKALPGIVDTVGGDLVVLADGGVRSGLDVLRYLSLGADAVLAGRPWVWALGSAGERGVAQLIAMLDAELRAAMALTGETRLAAGSGK